MSALLFTACLSSGNSQSETVSPEILKELLDINFKSDEGNHIHLKVAYPKNYDESKEYPIYLALSGGNQSASIVEYCYGAWFRSKWFDNYITVMPVNTKGKNLRDYRQGEIEEMLRNIKSKFNATSDGWILGGTSNGGAAAFNFLNINPTMFKGIIIMPGNIGRHVTISESWAHLSVLFAYGELDSNGWINGTKSSMDQLKGKVRYLDFVVMEGQGHIVSLDYDIDKVYVKYFIKKQEEKYNSKN